MNTKKCIVPIADQKILIYEFDAGNKYEVEFAASFKEAAATKPATIQEFIIQLNELQKKSYVNECLPD